MRSCRLITAVLGIAILAACSEHALLAPGEAGMNGGSLGGGGRAEDDGASSSSGQVETSAAPPVADCDNGGSLGGGGAFEECEGA